MRSVSPALLLLVAACATAPPGASRFRVTGIDNRTLVLGASSETWPSETLLEALNRLNPRFLDMRRVPAISPSDIDPVGVYINGTYAGDAEILSSILARDVVSVERLFASEATIRLPRRHNSGAVMVKLRRP